MSAYSPIAWEDLPHRLDHSRWQRRCPFCETWGTGAAFNVQFYPKKVNGKWVPSDRVEFWHCPECGCNNDPDGVGEPL